MLLVIIFIGLAVFISANIVNNGESLISISAVVKLAHYSGKSSNQNPKTENNYHSTQVYTGPVSIRGAAEASCKNISSIACPKIKCFCPNITWYFARYDYLKNSRGGAPPPPRLVRLCHSIMVWSNLKTVNTPFEKFLRTPLLYSSAIQMKT